jgi:DNA repair exonuclease SbcCD ATPase subunit
MDFEQILEEISSHQRSVQSAMKSLREISRLDKNRAENLPKLKKRLTKLEEIIRRIGETGKYIQGLTDWMSEYQHALETTEGKVRRRLGTELERKLKNLGLSLSGQYPDLKAGLFTIELDFGKWKATLWYGPKQERLDQCSLSASEIAKRVEKLKHKLGSQLPQDQFLEKLRKAYYRVIGTERGRPAPIIKVLAELAYLLQNSQFRQDPRRENYRSYSRADFSYDLFRIRSYQVRSLFPLKLRLKTAARAYTRRRSDFLWVPDDESGKGTTYSHLVFEEVEK